MAQPSCENALSRSFHAEDYSSLMRLFEIDEHASFQPEIHLPSSGPAMAAAAAAPAPAPSAEEENRLRLSPASAELLLELERERAHAFPDDSFQGLMRRFNIEEYSTLRSPSKSSLSAASPSSPSPRFSPVPCFPPSPRPLRSRPHSLSRRSSPVSSPLSRSQVRKASSSSSPRPRVRKVKQRQWKGPQRRASRSPSPSSLSARYDPFSPFTPDPFSTGAAHQAKASPRRGSPRQRNSKPKIKTPSPLGWASPILPLY